jgi:hypothetical protein
VSFRTIPVKEDAMTRSPSNGSSTSAVTFRAQCLHCRTVVLASAAQLAECELRQLHGHLGECRAASLELSLGEAGMVLVQYDLTAHGLTTTAAGES